MTAGGGSISYDSNQNIGSAGGNSYGYDAANRLTSATISGTGYTFAFDPADRLFESPGLRFQYAGDQLVGEYNSGGGLNSRHVPGPSLDEPVATLAFGGIFQQFADELGSVMGVSTPSAVNANRYDEYGVPNAANRFQYTGQAYLAPGLYNYRARIYAPGIGRFLQTDPIGYSAGSNLYAYVDADPVNRVDPLGLQDRPPCVKYGPAPDGEGCDAVWDEGEITLGFDLLRRFRFMFGSGGGANNSIGDATADTCPSGYFRRDASIGRGAFFGGFGSFESIGFRLRSPVESFGLPLGRGTQFSVYVNKTNLVGLGLFAGLDAQAGGAYSSSPLPPAGTRDLDGILAADAALIGGPGGQVTWDKSGGGGASIGGLLNAGFGAFAGYGAGEYATESFADILPFVGSEDTYLATIGRPCE